MLRKKQRNLKVTAKKSRIRIRIKMPRIRTTERQVNYCAMPRWVIGTFFATQVPGSELVSMRKRNACRVLYVPTPNSCPEQMKLSVQYSGCVMRPLLRDWFRADRYHRQNLHGVFDNHHESLITTITTQFTVGAESLCRCRCKVRYLRPLDF
jgi:hypothetical protein